MPPNIIITRFNKYCVKIYTIFNRKLKDNLSANGYEMPELLGKQYHQGMKVIVTSSIPDENLEKDNEIITKVLIPQVNYNEKMIQKHENPKICAKKLINLRDFNNISLTKKHISHTVSSNIIFKLKQPDWVLS